MNTPIHIRYCFRKLGPYSVRLHDTNVLPDFESSKFACLTVSNLSNCVDRRHSFTMLAFSQSIWTIIVKINRSNFLKKLVCFFVSIKHIWPLVLVGEMGNLFSFDQLWWPRGWAFDIKDCFKFKSLAFARLPPPPPLLQINIGRCIMLQNYY